MSGQPPVAGPGLVPGAELRPGPAQVAAPPPGQVRSSTLVQTLIYDRVPQF